MCIRDSFRYNAGLATKITGSTVDVSMPFVPGGEFHAYTLREPVGVCGLIVPWNFPLLMASFKLAPALAAGNTVILLSLIHISEPTRQVR